MECVAAIAIWFIGYMVIAFLRNNHLLKETQQELRYLDTMERIDQIHEEWQQKDLENSYTEGWRA